MKLTGGKTEVLGEKTCPSATLPTINPTWTDPRSNPGLRGERPETNGLSHGTAKEVNLFILTFFLINLYCWILIVNTLSSTSLFLLPSRLAGFPRSRGLSDQALLTHCSTKTF
jgi:hypothetical protein